MTTHATSHAPASTFVPQQLDGSKWSALEPYYAQLIGRTLHDAASLERLLLDRSELDAAAEEAAANLYIEMTRHTDDELARKRYLDFVEEVEPELKKAAFALDRKVVECPFAQQLDQSRYGVLLRGLRRSVELFREENIPIETEITKLDQKYSEANGAMTVSFDGEERTLPQMAKYLEETDRARRQASWEAVSARRLQDADRINDLSQRQPEAQQAGYHERPAVQREGQEAKADEAGEQQCRFRRAGRRIRRPHDHAPQAQDDLRRRRDVQPKRIIRQPRNPAGVLLVEPDRASEGGEADDDRQEAAEDQSRIAEETSEGVSGGRCRYRDQEHAEGQAEALPGNRCGRTAADERTHAGIAQSVPSLRQAGDRLGIRPRQPAGDHAEREAGIQSEN